MERSAHDKIQNRLSTGDAPGAGAGTTSKATPGPAGIVSLDPQADPLTFLGGLVREYGDAVRYTTKFGPCFLFVHPAQVETILHSENYRRASLVKLMLGDGLLAIDGPRWRSQRRLMQKDFLPAALAKFVDLIAHHTARTVREWHAAAKACQEVDVTGEMTRLTLRIIVDALFSDDMGDEDAARLCDAVTQTINHLGSISWTIFGAAPRFTPDTASAFAGSKNWIDSKCREMILRRRSQNSADRPRDLLSLLIESEGDDPAADQHLRDEIVTMLVGGHETTALVLSWAWKLLAEHPSSAAQLYEEVDAVLAGSPPPGADMPKLAWSRAIFQEAMRLYPPVWYMARVATEADVVDGHSIPRGACVLVSAWFTHRHEAFWPRPQEFDPARFLKPAPLHRYAYLPFGGGRHQCLGMHFALLEGTMILSQLAQSFAVHPSPGQDIRPQPGITLRQTQNMRATIELRQGPIASSLGAREEAL
ncbi:MAG TPA: cytochrome P450 [Humisphaera sp.]|nr:cytochrome P450 [Humisphaera sp.]